LNLPPHTNHFGAGTLRKVGPLAREFGNRALVVTGRDPSRAKQLTAFLGDDGITSVTLAVPGEPEIETVRIRRACKAGGLRFCRQLASAALWIPGRQSPPCSPNNGNVLDFLEVIGQGKSLTKPSAPSLPSHYAAPVQR